MNRRVSQLLAPALVGVALRVVAQRRRQRAVTETGTPDRPVVNPVHEVVAPEEVVEPVEVEVLEPAESQVVEPAESQVVESVAPVELVDEPADPEARSDLDRLFDGPSEPGEPDRGSDRLDEEHDDDEYDDEEERRGTRGRVLLAVVATLALVVVTGLLVRAAVSDSDPAVTDSSTQGTRAVVPRIPAGAPEEGSYSESRFTKDGRVQVQQWVRSPIAMFGLRLAPPSGAGASMKVTDLFVASNRAVLNQPETVGALGHRLFFDAPPLVVYVRYTLVGAVQRSPSDSTRALARATALDIVRSPDTGPFRVTLVGDNVLSVACATAPGSLQPCGTQDRGRWSVLLRGDARDNAVMAQVDLS